MIREEADFLLSMPPIDGLTPEILMGLVNAHVALLQAQIALAYRAGLDRGRAERPSDGPVPLPPEPDQGGGAPAVATPPDPAAVVSAVAAIAGGDLLVCGPHGELTRAAA